MKRHPIDGAHERAKTLRRDMTDAERKIWDILRSRQIDGYKFRRQVPIGRYIADFICHDAKPIIEVDGGQHDLSSAQEANIRPARIRLAKRPKLMNLPNKHARLTYEA